MIIRQIAVNHHQNPHLRQIQRATPGIHAIRKGRVDLRVVAKAVIALQIADVHQLDKEVLVRVLEHLLSDEHLFILQVSYLRHQAQGFRQCFIHL